MMPLNPTTPRASADRSLRNTADRSAGESSDQQGRAASSQIAPRSQAAVDQPRSHEPTAPGQGAGGPAEQATAVSGGGTASPAGRQPIKIPKIKTGLPLRKRPQEVRRIAIEVFPAADSWVIFYREILGVDGVARKLFKNVEEIRHWESSEEFLEIQEMLTALRSNDSGKGESVEPQRMITVRLPTSLHETLKAEANEHLTSMNKLCLSKLMMSISNRFVPIESGRIRGRRPGPQGKRKPAADKASDQ